jgi:hypothetical protein
MSQLAPPGSSSYSSSTLHVGDGTWDSGRDDFLLPNLVGLNFATMRYNGMGNRFFTMNGYQGLIKAHGIIAAITFLAVVPTAIFLMRFYGRNPRMALRLHIWLQILTLLLSTVIITLGFFAVGPKRRFTNPHHGIGLAIYVLIWVQTIGGALVHRSEKRNRSLYIPLKAMIHHWLGRAIALLGIVQIALGLTLYGSPAFLFVLYTLFTFGLFLAYFILEWLAERRRGRRVDDGGSYYSDEVVEGRPHKERGGFGKLAAAGVAGVGLAALWNRRKRKESRGDHDVAGTESDTGTGASYISNDKYSYDSRTEHHGWGRRILGIGALGGGLLAAKKFFGRKNDSSSDVGPYRPPLGGNQSVGSDTLSRIEEGRPPPTGQPMPPPVGSPGYIRPTHPLANPPMTPGRRESGSSYDYASFVSGSPSRQDRRGHGFRNALAAGGAAFAVRSLFKNRKQKKEEERVERERRERLSAERIARMNDVGRYTGDGVTPPRPIRNRVDSQSDSEFSGSVIDDRHQRPGMNSAIPIAGVGAAAGAALAERDRLRPPGTDPVINTSQGRINTASQQNMVYSGPPVTMPTDIPPPPSSHRIDEHSSGSELYTTASGRNRHRHRDEAAAGLAGAALGAAATDATRRRRSSNRNTDSAGSQYQSPPVSVHIKAHNDGRHVTLRRLTEEEAAAEAARQQAGAPPPIPIAGPSTRRRRNSSFSSASDGEMLGTNRRYRRMEQIEAQQQQQAQAQAEAAASGFPPPPLAPGGSTQILVPPPPIPDTAPSGVTSPGTEASSATEYANNRRRRRAERAQARLAREGRAGGGNTVEFS